MNFYFSETSQIQKRHKDRNITKTEKSQIQKRHKDRNVTKIETSQIQRDIQKKIFTIFLYFSSKERTSSSISNTLLSRSCRLSAKCDEVDNNSNGVLTASPSSSRRAEKCVKPQVISCCTLFSVSLTSCCKNLFLT